MVTGEDTWLAKEKKGSMEEVKGKMAVKRGKEEG